MNTTARTASQTLAALAILAALLPPSQSTPVTLPVVKTSCAATPLPAPYGGVDPCNADAVTCASLSALFTWNPATDQGVDSGYRRVRPLIAAGGLTSPDGTPQHPFNPADNGADFDTTAAWRDATDHWTALVAYTTRRSQGATRANALFDVIQYRYPTDAVDAQGNLKPSATSTGAAWEWWVTARTATDPDGGQRISYLTQYSPPSQPDTGKPAPDPASRWSCQPAG